MSKADKFHRMEDYSTLSYSYEISPKCLLTTQTTAGPFYLPDVPQRINLIENQIGVNLYLGLKIVNSENCKKLPGATVLIWHTNAFGYYSGFNGRDEEHDSNISLKPMNSERWLRGKQISDDLGFLEFRTLWPGKYRNRTNHIHLKVFYQNKEYLCSQLFFPQNLNDFVDTMYPYNQNYNPITNRDDPILKYYRGVRGGWPRVSPFGASFIATLTIGIKIT